MKLSKAYWQTYKETPADAEVPSHRLLLRAGFLNKTTGGIYSYLPMASRVLNKIKKIVRDELDSIGGQELLMSFVTPAELWKSSGRWGSMGPEMIRLKDRKDGDFCLSATNEETITDIFKNTVSSYKQLPVNLYQINTKFRDEIRPRFGILRGREFIMKDAYTFHTNKECMDKMYDSYFKAYSNIYNKMGLEFIAVEADGGNMADAGSKTHEFQVIADTGEDDIITAREIGYAANIETAATVRAGLEFSPSTELVNVETKDLSTCEEVAKLLNIPVHQTLKTLVYTATYAKKDGSTKDAHYLLMILGDDEANEVKLNNYFKGAVKVIATSEEVLKELDLPKGYMSPLGKEGISVILDSAIDLEAGYVVGANKVDFHTKGFTPNRDIKEFKQADIRLTKKNDLAPDGKTEIQFRKGIEAGQIFQLGSKYTKAMGATVLDEKGKKVNPLMGCYGIGISRTLAAAVEQHHDEDGIIWPAAIAPYDIYFAVIGKKESTKELSNNLYEELKNAGLEVLLDDRGLGPGGMFKDADLLGLPVRVLLGERDYETSGELELKIRKTGEVIKVSKENLASKLIEVLASLGKNI
jgi:prolyl-tRNA synthetase